MFGLRKEPDIPSGFEPVGAMQCIPDTRGGKCDYCHENRSGEELYFSLYNHLWMCEDCRRMEEWKRNKPKRVLVYTYDHRFQD